MTWQLKDTIALFAGTQQDNNGEQGEPYWVGDFNFIWEKGPWQAFWGIDAIGRTSNVADFERVQTVGICQVTDAVRPNAYCVDVVGEHKLYHSLSLTRTFSEERIGRSSFTSQYDYVGRRGFLNVKATF
jgi:iron complex outermembrane receptor protein